MPDPHTTAIVLFWAQIVSGFAAALFIGQWMWHQARKIGDQDMTSFAMKYPRVLLGVIALSLSCGVAGLWLTFHLPKPPIPSPPVSGNNETPVIPPRSESQMRADQHEVRKLVIEYETTHRAEASRINELDWVNKQLKLEGIPFKVTHIETTRRASTVVPKSKTTTPDPSQNNGGTAIIGAHGETKLDNVHVFGYPTGIDLRPSDKADVKNTDVHRQDTLQSPEEKK